MTRRIAGGRFGWRSAWAWPRRRPWRARPGGDGPRSTTRRSCSSRSTRCARTGCPRTATRRARTPAPRPAGARGDRLRGRLQPRAPDPARPRLAVHRPAPAAPRRPRQHRLHAGAGHRTLAERFKAGGLRDRRRAVSAYVLRVADRHRARLRHLRRRARRSTRRRRVARLRCSATARPPSSRWLRWIEAQGGQALLRLPASLRAPHALGAAARAPRASRTPTTATWPTRTSSSGGSSTGSAQEGVLDRAIVAVTSDHGEGLGDHGEEEHGIFLYREAVHVPLILRLPGGARRGHARRRARPPRWTSRPRCSSWPACPRTAMDGASLRPASRAGRTASRPVYSETLFPRYHFGWSELFAVSDARYRLIRAPRPELFDVERDPGEKTNLAPLRAAGVACDEGLAGRQVRWARSRRAKRCRAETREKLQALGYVGTARRAALAASDLPDPKDRIGDARGAEEALALRRAGGATRRRWRSSARWWRENPLMIDAWEASASASSSWAGTRRGSRRSTRPSRSTRRGGRTWRWPSSTRSKGGWTGRRSTPRSRPGRTRARRSRCSRRS